MDLMLQALVTGRAVSMEVEILCNVCGVFFNMTVAVTWWCLTLAHLVKMWHVNITRRGYYVTTAAIWGLAGILAVLPLLTSKRVGSSSRVGSTFREDSISRKGSLVLL